MIQLKFSFVNTKYVSKIKFMSLYGNKEKHTDLIFDTGCTMTTISEKVFNRSGFILKDERPIKIYGINGESSGVSTIISNFMLGGENLGDVRVAVGKLLPEFENCVILGVNVLAWYNYSVDHGNRMITLAERNFKNLSVIKSERFTRLYSQILNLPARAENLTDEEIEL